MKLWYQSMTRTESWGGYLPVLQRVLDKAKDAGTEIEVHGILGVGGMAPQYRYLEYLETGEVMANIEKAISRGFDAFLIGNIGDPGLRECREIAPFPVLGLCESAMHLACMMGANFAFVGLNEKFTRRVVENADRANLRPRLHSAPFMTMERILDLKEGFSSDEAKTRIIARFLQVGGECVDAGAEVIIPAGGVPMTLLADAGVHEVKRGAPILNGITALVKMGEMAVRLDKLMGGRFTSKRLAYAPPGLAQIEEIRKHYGNVYPTIPGYKSE